MQILTTHFLDEIDCPVINIHHFFLPAFISAAPYRLATATRPSCCEVLALPAVL